MLPNEPAPTHPPQCVHARHARHIPLSVCMPDATVPTVALKSRQTRRVLLLVTFPPAVGMIKTESKRGVGEGEVGGVSALQTPNFLCQVAQRKGVASH